VRGPYGIKFQEEYVNKKVLCCGTLVVDIFCGPVKGVIAPDTGFAAAISPREGGNALNVAVSLSKLGHPRGLVHLCGVAGDDIYAEMFERYLEKHGVKPHVKKVRSSESAKCLILGFGGGKRAFVGFKGANNDYTAQDVKAAIRKVKPGIFYCGETSALPRVDARIREVLSLAKGLGAVNVMDYIIAGGKPSGRLFSAAKLADFFHINDYEAKMLTKKDAITDALAILMKKGFKLPVITAGGKPLVFGFKGRKYRMPAYRVRHIDSTGAGDAFTAGFIREISRLRGKAGVISLLSPERLVDMLLFAQAAGAAAVTETGCTAGVSMKKAEGLMAVQGRGIATRTKIL